MLLRKIGVISLKNLVRELIIIVLSARHTKFASLPLAILLV
jgi:hypothetical protein